MKEPKGKHFYGAVTVGGRGQIVVPAKARRDFGIKAGDKLLVFGDVEQGLGLAPPEMVFRNIGFALDLMDEVNAAVGTDEGDDEESDDR